MLNKYILYSVIGLIITPILFMFTPIINMVGLFLTYPYIYPLVALATFLGQDNWFREQMFEISPNGNGWFVLLFVIVVFGIITGTGLYKLREHLYGKDNRPVPNFGFSGFAMTFLFVLLIDFILIFLTGPKVTAIQKYKWASSKQQYIKENCQRIDEVGKHYYSCKNPSQLILDTSFEQYLR